ncbi:MAG: hypothetical protein ABDI19_08090 [Armatimonadota bacterium]
MTGMVSLTLSDEQLIALVEQLPFEVKLKLWRLLEREIRSRQAEWSAHIRRLREYAQSRGLDWDALDDEARLALADDFLNDN